jgi:hypothetical protein
MLSPSFMPVFGSAVLAMALGAAGCSKPEKPLIHTRPPSVANRVLILNADTLVIDGRHVHLSNASSPQSTLHARCWAEALLAAKEIAYVRDLVDEAVAIDFKPNGQVDSYDRELGQVSLDGQDLGDELYDHGMAARLTNPRFDWCQPISQKADGAPPISAVINLGQ